MRAEEDQRVPLHSTMAEPFYLFESRSTRGGPVAFKQNMAPAQILTQTESSRPGRAARTILFITAVVGAGALVFTFFAIPVFSAMFDEFGSDLPAITQFMISVRPVYLLSAVISGALSYHLLYSGAQRRHSLSLMLGLLALEYFVLVMTFAAMFMPILQLGAVAPE